MSPNLDQSNSFDGIKRFLFDCPSASMAQSVGEAIDTVIHENDIEYSVALTVDTLELVRQELYKRKDDSGAGQIDVLLMLADAMGGGRSQLSSNPFESRLRFIEIMQEQIQEDGKVNIPLAFEQANR
jgi:hypothetical protein